MIFNSVIQILCQKVLNDHVSAHPHASIARIIYYFNKLERLTFRDEVCGASEQQHCAEGDITEICSLSGGGFIVIDAEYGRAAT